MNINHSLVVKFIICSLLFMNSCSCNESSTAPADNERPTAPGNLSEVTVLSYRVTIQWDASTDNNGVAGYRIYRDGNAIGTSAGTIYCDSTVRANTAYSYTAAAYDATGNESGQSEALNVTTPSAVTENPTIIDNRNTNAAAIPDGYITEIKNTLHIAYQHTSHGSQIISGMEALAGYSPFNNRYQWSDDGSAGLDLDDYGIEGCADLSQGDDIDSNGVTPWVTATRALLDNTENYHINVVMWSWCSINGHDINRYLTNMETLIDEYGIGGSNARAAAHPVEFVFMTGHTEGGGEEGVVAQAAAQIRTHCITNNRWLIDYYTIECYDPKGNYYGDHYITDNLNYDGGNWAVDYITIYGDILNTLTMGDAGSFSGCTSCAHSDTPRQATLNCILKGQAAWQIFARICGWDGN